MHPMGSLYEGCPNIPLVQIALAVAATITKVLCVMLCAALCHIGSFFRSHCILRVLTAADQSGMLV